MAVSVSKSTAKLILKAENGQTQSGKINYINRAYDNLNTSLENTDIYSIAEKIESLSKDTFGSISKSVTDVLVQQ